LDRPILRTLRLCVHLRLLGYVAANVGQNNRIVSAAADTRKVTTVSANQPMVEASTDSCYTGTSYTQGNGCLAAELIADTEA
jgi:hypothetical protein